MDRPLKRARITNAEVLTALTDAGLRTCKDVLSLTSFELLRKVSKADFEQLNLAVEQIAAAVAPKPSTALEVLTNSRLEQSFVPTGLPSLDQALRGGVPPASVTEVTGAAGLGKTQLCMSLSVAAVHQWPEGTVLYLDTEGSFAPARLAQIARERYPALNQQQIDGLIKRVHVARVPEAAQLAARLDGLESYVIEHSVKLLLVDSIANPARKQNSTLMERQDILVRQAATLKWISESFGIPAVVTNQVTGYRGKQSAVNAPSAAAGEDAIELETVAESAAKPALGNTWAHCVGTRLWLLPDSTIKIAKSPSAPTLTVAYSITDKGMQETIPEEDNNRPIDQ